MKDSQERKLVTLLMQNGIFSVTMRESTAYVYKEVSKTTKPDLIAEYNVTKKKWVLHDYLPFGAKEKIEELANAKLSA